ncbi:ATP-binding protein [Irregularibacter muris]|nr:ATP-binding protein [Irregularibacter muris]
MKLNFPVDRGEFASAGKASSRIKKILQNIGLNNAFVRKVAIATYEAEMNLVIHSLGGQITISIGEGKVIIEVEDRGPGIENIELAMTEGYSTATEVIREMGFGAGMGLPNIKKCSDDLSIQSKVGEGTKMIMSFNYQ